MSNPPPRPGKTAAVTGAASGIGRAFSIALAGRGYNLILIDRSREGAAGLAEKLTSEIEGLTAEVCAADLTSPEDLEGTAKKLRECSSLDLLVNCAGFGTSGDFIEADFATQKKLIDIHVTAAVTLCRAALPGMVACDSGGIINVCSTAAVTRFPGLAVYVGCKMFMVAFTECLEVETAKMGARNVTIQALCPGHTRTAFNQSETMKGFDSSRMPAYMYMTPERLVELSLNRFDRGSGTYIPLLRNKVYWFVLGNGVVIRTIGLMRKWGITEGILRVLKK